MTLSEKYSEVIKIHKAAKALLDSGADDEFIHQEIFSDAIRGRVKRLGYDTEINRDLSIEQCKSFVDHLEYIAENCSLALHALSYSDDAS